MVSIFIKPLMAVLTKVLMATASGPLIEWAFFYLAKAIVKSTKTPHDDEFLKLLRENYDKPPRYDEHDKRTG